MEDKEIKTIKNQLKEVESTIAAYQVKLEREGCLSDYDYDYLTQLKMVQAKLLVLSS